MAEVMEENAALHEKLELSRAPALNAVISLLANNARKEAREDAPDLSPMIEIEVAFCATEMMIGRGRRLDRETADPVENEKTLKGYPKGVFCKQRLKIHASELPAFQAHVETLDRNGVENVLRDLRKHEELLKENRINELAGRYYIPSLFSSFRRVEERGMKPLLYVKELN